MAYSNDLSILQRWYDVQVHGGERVGGQTARALQPELDRRRPHNNHNSKCITGYETKVAEYIETIWPYKKV
jgi:hypothetical protein